MSNFQLVIYGATHMGTGPVIRIHGIAIIDPHCIDRGSSSVQL